MKTVKIKIAVQVDPEGNWDAGGDSCVTTGNWDDHNGNFDLENAKRYWIEKDLPVPEAPAEPETVEGEAVEETAAPAATEAA